jgi:hypothetical protein
MPIYTIENTKTGECKDITVSYEDLEKLLLKKKYLRRVFKPIMIVDPVGIGVTKPPSDFQKYVLGRVKEKTGGSAIANKRWTIPKEI